METLIWLLALMTGSTASGAVARWMTSERYRVEVASERRRAEDWKGAAQRAADTAAQLWERLSLPHVEMSLEPFPAPSDPTRELLMTQLMRMDCAQFRREFDRRCCTNPECDRCFGPIAVSDPPETEEDPDADEMALFTENVRAAQATGPVES